MASKSTASLQAFFLFLNLILFPLVFVDGLKEHSVLGLKEHHSTPGSSTCPRDTLKFGLCANLLGVNVTIGSPPTVPCCSLIRGLVDLEAAVCLCTAIKANVLGIINLDLPVSLSLVLNNCGRSVPTGFQCA